MQKITKKMLVAAMLLSCGIAQADDTQHLVVLTKNGSNQYELKTVKNIVLNESGITVNGEKSELASFDYASVEKIYFMLASKIAESTVAKFSVSLDADGSVLRLLGVEGATNVRVFSMDGRMVKNLSQWKGSAIDVADLTHGVYIIQVDNQAVKFKK